MSLTMPTLNPDLDIEPVSDAERLQAKRRALGLCITCARRPQIYNMDHRGRCGRCVRRFAQKRRWRQESERYRRLRFVSATGASVGEVHRLRSSGRPRRWEMYLFRSFRLMSASRLEATYLERPFDKRVKEAIMKQDQAEWGGR